MLGRLDRQKLQGRQDTRRGNRIHGLCREGREVELQTVDIQSDRIGVLWKQKIRDGFGRKQRTWSKGLSTYFVLQGARVRRP